MAVCVTNCAEFADFPPKWQADAREQSAELAFLHGGWLG